MQEVAAKIKKSAQEILAPEEQTVVIPPWAPQAKAWQQFPERPMRRELPPPPQGQKHPPRAPKKLTDDDVTRFEKAAESRPEALRGLLPPPYDPEQEPRIKQTRRRTNMASTRRMSAALEVKDRWRLRSLRRDLRWVEKHAFKNQIYLEEIDLWRL